MFEDFLNKPDPLCKGRKSISRNRQDALKLREMNTFPWSQTIISGTITGRAAACSRRSSRLSSRRCGSTERDIRRASAQPGRINSGVTARASSTLASTDVVVGRSTPSDSVLVATSIMPVSSIRPGTPSSSRTIASIGVESICMTWPGANAGSSPNGEVAPV
ncbi:hypothetical protein ACFXAF_25545 [Kitasatospora sp. NPDC059463]|uniref:hypothetical protein n=1 Tax=unclassified Kitasatospora TaxID=2633591 RepID=UPI0036CC3D48